MVEADPNAARRTAILDAATIVFSRYGFKKTSMDDLARAAGLSRQGLYLHFATKEALFKDTVLRLIAATRAAGRAALSRDDLDIEARLLGAFEAVHGIAVGQGADHLNELLEAATQHVGPVIDDLEKTFAADITRAIRAGGVADRWKDEGTSAKELAETLCAASYGWKHRVATAADYRERMRIAVRIVCRSR